MPGHTRQRESLANRRGNTETCQQMDYKGTQFYAKCLCFFLKEAFVHKLVCQQMHVANCVKKNVSCHNISYRVTFCKAEVIGHIINGAEESTAFIKLLLGEKKPIRIHFITYLFLFTIY